MINSRMATVAVLVLAVALGVGAFWAARLIRPASDDEAVHRDPKSEVAWMRSEFGLSDEQFRRVEKLHVDYVPVCDEYCRRVAVSGLRVRELAAANDAMTEELAAAIRDDERTRAACREALLAHLYETARAMPPEKGRRFLEMALPKVLSPDHPDVHRAMNH